MVGHHNSIKSANTISRSTRCGVTSVILGGAFWTFASAFRFWLWRSYPGSHSMILPAFWFVVCIMIPCYLGTLVGIILAVRDISHAKRRFVVGHVGLILAGSATPYVLYNVFVLCASSAAP